MIYLKQAATTPETDHQDVRDLVQVMLARIAIEGEAAVRDYSRTFDKWEGDLTVSRATLDAAAAQVPERLKDDIRFAHANIRRFAAELSWPPHYVTQAERGAGFAEVAQRVLADRPAA